MGTFATGYLVVNVADRKKSARLPNLLVDSGSEATWIPRRVLDSIGIAPAKSLSFRMANGSLVHRDVGYALVRVGRRETADDVVFAEPGDYALLGARTLEGLNLWVDAANKKLVPGRPWPLELVIVPPDRPRRRRKSPPAGAAKRKSHKKVALAHPAPANLPAGAASKLRILSPRPS